MKINISKLLITSAILTTLNLKRQTIKIIEFDGEFKQGHFIKGIVSNPTNTMEIQIDKKIIKEIDKGYFVFGIDRDRKKGIVIELYENNEIKYEIKKYNKEKISNTKIEWF